MEMDIKPLLKQYAKHGDPLREEPEEVPLPSMFLNIKHCEKAKSHDKSHDFLSCQKQLSRYF